MNHIYKSGVICKWSGLLFWVVISGCTVTHFESPQPADLKDEKIIPASLHGKWQPAEEAFFNKPKENEILKISANQVSVTRFDSIKIVNYALSPGPSSSEGIAQRYYKNNTLSSEKTIKFVIKGKLIYWLRDDALSNGFVFRMKKDTLCFREEKIWNLTLNQTVFFRRMSTDLFTVCVPDFAMEFENYSTWPTSGFQLFLLKVNASDSISIGYPNVSYTDKHPEWIVHKSDDHNFLNPRWKADELKDEITKGLFGDEYLVLKRIGR